MKQQGTRWKSATLVVAGGIYATAIIAHGLTGRADDNASGGGSFLLTGARPTPPTTIGDFVRDNDAAVVLGKALFWEMQAGSDGQTACASCHFHAGADNRTANSLSPGGNRVFNRTATGHVGPNTISVAGDFPFHRLENVNANTSTVLFDTDDVLGSQGVLRRSFLSVGGTPVDSCVDESDPTFNVNGVNVRAVTPRQAPTAINAAFNYRNFWDGRARENFNGANPAGQADSNARIFRTIGGVITPVAVLIDHSSAASQATGPTLSGVEMSCIGRTWPNVGRKLLNLVPLGEQHVSASDSVFAAYVSSSGVGLNTSYTALIMMAFQPDLWNGVGTVTIGGADYSQMEANFSLFWGLAIQAYESTLISDDAPVDRYASGQVAALSSDARAGLAVFQGQGRCVECHKGPTFTDATNSGGHSFENIGVRQLFEDPGDVLESGRGRFKTPTLRNIELLGPYFHNGGQATLAQVVDYYNRGGDFPTAFTDSQIRPLGLTDAQKHSLVSFLLSLTDDRVRFERAPFDHP